MTENMMKIRKMALLLTLGSMIALSACSDKDEDSRVTESRLNDIDNIEGTINDDMINTDTVENQDAVEETGTAGEPASPASSTGGDQSNPETEGEDGA